MGPSYSQYRGFLRLEILKQIRLTTYYLMVSFMSLYACIEEYRPEIEYIESNKYVVYGELTTEEENHIISVALASAIQEPQYIPRYMIVM